VLPSLQSGCPLSITVNIRHHSALNLPESRAVYQAMVVMALVTVLVAFGIVPATLAIGR
jgi:hypothetical protein